MWMVPFENITKVLEVCDRKTTLQKLQLTDRFLKIFYFTELLYLTAIALTKISVLLFYLRLFPHRRLRQAIYGTIVACILYIIGFVVATALQCLPIHIAWDHWDGEHHGKCLNLNALAWASAGVNIILDLVVIILPMRELKNLVISRRRKFGVMLMFLGGGLYVRSHTLTLRMLIPTQRHHRQRPTPKVPHSVRPHRKRNLGLPARWRVVSSRSRRRRHHRLPPCHALPLQLDPRPPIPQSAHHNELLRRPHQRQRQEEQPTVHLPQMVLETRHAHQIESRQGGIRPAR
jgi:hypothetical protein